MDEFLRLLGPGADRSEIVTNYGTALDLAILNGANRIVHLLVEQKADVNAVNYNSNENNRPLHLAACAQHGVVRLDVMELLIRNGANVNVYNTSGDSPLHIALHYGAKVDVVRLLIRAGANVNAANVSGKTPLHMATDPFDGVRVDFNVVQLLISEGADVNAEDSIMHVRPIHNIVRFTSGDHADVLGLLVAAGADVSAVNLYQEPPIVSAVNRGSVGCVEVLIDARADVNAHDPYGLSVLRRAVEGGNVAIVRMLTRAGANVGGFDRYGFTILSCASRRGNADVVRAILDAGANINERNNANAIAGNEEITWTPLMRAARYDKRPVMELLIRRGADWTLTEIQGQHRDALQLTPNAHTRAFLQDLINTHERYEALVSVHSSPANPLHIIPRHLLDHAWSFTRQ